jgi:hypothetical protein
MEELNHTIQEMKKSKIIWRNVHVRLLLAITHPSRFQLQRGAKSCGR